MKVGIMTMQRIINYGSFLQAYSLKKTIENLGHSVEFVDYEPGEVLVNDKGTLKERVADKIKWLLNRPTKEDKERIKKEWQLTRQYDQKFIEELLPLLGIGREKNYKAQLDTLVIGSDEVFNCLQTNPDVGYAKELFGEGNQANKVLSYAASFGNTTYENLHKYKIADEISQFLKGFSHLSVRDLNSISIVKRLTNYKAQLNVDPVLLYDYEGEIPTKRKGKDYIVVYAYAYRITKRESEEIKRFAIRNNKQIICLCQAQNHLGNFIPATPFDILAYIRDADYVITDTFHGSVFSIKYNKVFAVFTRQGHGKRYGNNEKLLSLLRQFELTDRIVEKARYLEETIIQPINYDCVNQRIKQEKEKSIQYLSESIA